jgi:hypothetical protein
MDTHLDQFGQIVVTKVYDDILDFNYEIINGNTRWGTDMEVTKIFEKLSLLEKQILIDQLRENLSTIIFSFLNIFEENPQYFIGLRTGNIIIDIKQFTETLNAEPLGEDGWIERFSKYSKRNSKSEE